MSTPNQNAATGRRFTKRMPGRYANEIGAVLRRYDNDVTGRGVEWVLTVHGSWVTTMPTKRAAIAEYESMRAAKDGRES